MNSAEISHQPEGCCMAFTPQSCPTKGGEVLFITYSDDFPLPSPAEFFLVFEGSNQQHVTTAQQINAYTLQAVAPRHDKAERVCLAVHCYQDGTIGLLSSHMFIYNLETENILADVLAQHVSDPRFLELCISLCSLSNNISGDVRETLDSRFTEAFEQLELSPSWTLLGEDSLRNGIDNGFETLLHLSAHLGFSQLAMCLLDKPGADNALSLLDRNGKSPLDIANDKGLTKLVDAFARGANSTKQPSVPNDKPHATKTEIGTTTISSFKKQNKNSIEKDIDMLREMHNLVKDELNRKTPIFKHSWPVAKPSSRTTEDKSSTSDSSAQAGRRDDLRVKVPSSNRQLLEQNLKRLRDINEEIQRLRVTSQRNHRESPKGPADKRQMRRLSCPSFRGQDILQAHMLIGKTVPSEERPCVDQPSTGTGSGEEQLLGVDESPDLRRRSWGDTPEEQTKPEYQRRVSSSLDDLTGSERSEPVKRTKDPARSKTQVIELPKHLTKQQESNKLADILDSIKSEDKPGGNKKLQTRNATSVSMQGKSYSYSCLASLPLDDGVDSGQSGESNAGDQRSTNGQKSGTNEEMSLLDFLSYNDPDDSAEDSEEPAEKDKPIQEKGIRRLSMLFGSKAARHSKRELPKPGHTKSRERSSMRKEKGQSMINLSVKDAEFKDRTDNSKDVNSKTAIGRRASGLSHRSSKLGEGATLPNPGMLTNRMNSGSKLSASHSFKSTSPLPFRKNLNPSQGDEGDDKSMSGVSMEGSGDEDMDEEGVFAKEYDSDMELKDEADAWSLTVPKQILKKMNAKDVKRQDVIHELIQTEEHYVVTLKIMFKIFYSGMIKDLHMPKDTVNSIFPQIEELLDLHSNFLNSMKAKENSDTVVERIGEVLEHQFSASSGNRMKKAYGDFCSHHTEAVALYKKLHKNDKKFADFVKKCSVNKICRRLSIPECITLVTQRLTKYPLLFEAIIKTTKEVKHDLPFLKKATTLVKEVLFSVDNTIKEYEKQKTLQDIKMRMDLKVAITYGKGNKKVKNIDFASNSSALHHEGVLLWKTARGKFVECVVVIMDDMIVFLQEKDQKYSLLSLDQKAPVIRLNNLFVREVATDTKAIFLVSTSKEGPEMYEMVCRTPSEKKMWIKHIKEAIQSAPKDKGTGELITTKAGEMRKHLLQRAATLMEEVQNAEPERQPDFLPDIQDLIAKIEHVETTVKGTTKEELIITRESLVRVMNHVQALATEESQDQFSENSLSPTITSADVGFKRAETFSGFDNRQKLANADPAVTRAWSMKTERTVKSYNRPEPAVSTPDLQGSPATKHKRKGSGGSAWSFRNKNKDDKEGTEGKGDPASSSASSSPVNTPDQDPMENEDNDECATEMNSDNKDVIYF